MRQQLGRNEFESNTDPQYLNGCSTKHHGSVSNKDLTTSNPPVESNLFDSTLKYAGISPINRWGRHRSESGTEHGSSGIDRSKVTLSCNNNSKSMKKKNDASKSNTWDWVTAVQTDFSDKDSARLQAYVARQKALSMVGTFRQSMSTSNLISDGRKHPKANRISSMTSNKQHDLKKKVPHGDTISSNSVFTCTVQEVQLIRDALASEFAESIHLYSDGYLVSVLCEYDARYPKRRRTVPYCVSYFNFFSLICSLHADITQ